MGVFTPSRLFDYLVHTTARNWFLLLFASCLWFLLISWEFAVSLSMIGLCMLFLFEWQPALRCWTWRSTLPEAWKRLSTDPSWLALMVPFLLVLFTTLYSSDLNYALNRLQVKVPFIALTIAFAGLPVSSRRTYHLLHYLLILLVTMAAIPVLVYYVQFADLLHQSIGEGRALDTPSNHIRFSMAAALACCSGLFLWEQGFFWRWKQERWFLLALILFLFLFIHVLAVRTGIVCLYIGLFFLFIRYLYLRRAWLKGLLLLILMGSMPWLAYKQLPAFQAKVHYMIWDFQQFKAGNRIDNSDSNRLVSMQFAWEIFKEHPLLGVGVGDLRNEMNNRYASQAPHLKPLIPHNQWLYVLAGTGILGTGLFILAFFTPLFVRKRYLSYPFLLWYSVFFLAFTIEAAIENNYGISLFLLFVLPGLRQSPSEQSNQQA